MAGRVEFTRRVGLYTVKSVHANVVVVFCLSIANYNNEI